MNISKKIISCAAACAVLGIGVTAYAAQTAAEDVPAESAPISESLAPVEENVPVEAGAPIEEESAPDEAASFSGMISLEDWASRQHALPSAYAPKDLDFFHTGNHIYITTHIPAKRGSEVYSVDDGEVVFADYSMRWNLGHGNVVVIKHAENLYTVYEHLLPEKEGGKAVSTGDIVKAGQCIGFAGISGNTSDYGVGYICYTEEPRVLQQKKVVATSGATSANDARPEAQGVEVPNGYLGIITDEDGNVVEMIPMPVD